MSYELVHADSAFYLIEIIFYLLFKYFLRHLTGQRETPHERIINKILSALLSHKYSFYSQTY